MFFKVVVGEWVVDVIIINVFYFLVNVFNIDIFIYFVNEMDKEVDVIVIVIDNNGKEYGLMNFGVKLVVNIVIKIFELVMDILFGFKGVVIKLSVIFNIDVDKGDVNVYVVS